MREVVFECEQCGITEECEPWSEEDGLLIGPPCQACGEPMLPQDQCP